MNSTNENKSLTIRERFASTEGRVGYLIAWLLGVPTSVLVVIFLIRGH